MVLHHVSDDSILVKVASASLRPDILFETDVYAAYVLTIPQRLEDKICEAQTHDTLRDLFCVCVCV